MKRLYFLEMLNGGYTPTDEYRKWLNAMNCRYKTFGISSFIFKQFRDETMIYITYYLGADEGFKLHKIENDTLNK